MRQVTRREVARRLRGFSMVEAVVSFGLFLIVAAVVTWSLSVAFTSSSQASARADLSAVLTAHADEVALIELTDLTSGQFSVPDACDTAVVGIGGTSCATSNGQRVTVAYRFTGPGSTGVCPARSADPAQVLAEHGFIQIQACVTAVSSAAFVGQESTGAHSAVPTQTRTIVATTPGLREQGRAVTVHLDGAFAELGDRPVLLLDGADLTRVVASGPLEAGSVSLTLPSVTSDAACSPVSPCVLGLSTGTPHTRTSVPEEGAEFTTTLELNDWAGPSAPVSVGDGATAQVRARVTLTSEPAAVSAP